MYIILAHIHVKAGCVDAFKDACEGNSRGSVQEPGCLRFAVLQQADDPTRFVLHEVYRTEADFAHHKEQQHYFTWRDTVADMQAEDRYATKYHTVFPADSAWD